MTPPNLIAFAGPAQAGKTEAAKIVARLYGHEVRSFADGVRAFAERLDPLLSHGGFAHPLSWFIARGNSYAWLKEHTEYRDVLVAIGAGAREVIGEDVWVDALLMPRLTPDPWVIDDCRYWNEAKIVRRLTGTVVHLERPGVEPANDEERRSLAQLRNLGLVDVYLQNDGDLAHLEAEIRGVFG